MPRIGELDYRYGTEIEAPVQERTNRMSFVVCAVSALSVAGLFYSWRAYHLKHVSLQKQMRERVTYMLWVMANSVPDCR